MNEITCGCILEGAHDLVSDCSPKTDQYRSNWSLAAMTCIVDKRSPTAVGRKSGATVLSRHLVSRRDGPLFHQLFSLR